MEDHGYVPSTKVLNHRVMPAEASTAAELDLSPGENLIVVEKLFLENQHPVILTVNHIPEKMIVELYSEGDVALPVFEFLANYGQQHLSYYLSEFVPILANGSIAGHLNVPKSAPLLSLEEVGYSEDNAPILKAYSYFRDDLLRLRFIRREV